MKRLLATTAIVMATMTGTAFAQDANFTVVDDNSVVANGSLLQQVLNQAQDVQLNMLNAAENLANLDGSINVLESANVDLLLQELTSNVSFGGGEQLYTYELANGTAATGTLEEYEAEVAAANATYDYTDPTTTNAVTGQSYSNYLAALVIDPTLTATVNAGQGTETVDLVEVNDAEDTIAGILKGVSRTVDGTTAIDFYDPATLADSLQTDVKNLTTTVIGALNTGVIGSNDGTGNIASNILTMANMELESVASTTSSLAQSSNYFQPGDLQLSNVAANMATVVDASVTIDQLMANVDTVGTTLIGALNTGDIAASVNQNASNLSAALVGQ